MASYVIELDAYHGKTNSYVLKELAIAPIIGNETVKSWVFKPPYPWDSLPMKSQTSNRWLAEKKEHALWQEGFFHYAHSQVITDMILPSFAVLFVKWDQKTTYVRDHLAKTRTVINLDTLGCPKAECIRCNVSVDSSHMRCTRTPAIRAQKLAFWCKKMVSGLWPPSSVPSGTSTGTSGASIFVGTSGAVSSSPSFQHVAPTPNPFQDTWCQDSWPVTDNYYDLPEYMNDLFLE